MDETMDFGEDTATPVIEDYGAQTPFKFTGTLDKFVIYLGESKPWCRRRARAAQPEGLRNGRNRAQCEDKELEAISANRGTQPLRLA